MMSFSMENVNPLKVDVVSVLFYAEFPETATVSGNSRHLRNMSNEQMSDQVVTVAELSRLFLPQDFEKKNVDVRKTGFYQQKS